MIRVGSDFIGELYKKFEAPISAINCGNKCAPYNDKGVPFCCDTHHAVPSAHHLEWDFLNSHTDLWHLWINQDRKLTENLLELAPVDHVLIECLGHEMCQREFRSITCRSFPFFPYIDQWGAFLGLAYYWQYEDRCWIISNLQVISREYLQEFVDTYDNLFVKFPDEKENFRQYSITMRRVFGRLKRTISLIHRNGFYYKVSPRQGRLRRVVEAQLPKFGPYKIADKLPFPDELPGYALSS